MTEMFNSLTIGLAASVLVIQVLLTGYFQSFRLALVSIGGVPGVILGVATMLVLTGTSLNIESFMGSIMCIGVSVSNAVLLSTFMERPLGRGATPQIAAIEGGSRSPAADPHDSQHCRSFGHRAHGGSLGGG